MRIKKNDTIQVISGKDRGKTGKVLKINLKGNTALVQGVNLYKKHVRPKRQGEKGEIVTITRPLNLSKVMLYCSNCRKGVRAGVRVEKDGVKTHFCKKCKVTL